MIPPTYSIVLRKRQSLHQVSFIINIGLPFSRHQEESLAIIDFRGLFLNQYAARHNIILGILEHSLSLEYSAADQSNTSFSNIHTYMYIGLPHMNVRTEY